MKKLKSGIVTLIILALCAFAIGCDEVELSQLTTPANVAVSGTTLNWDKVDNATGYRVEINAEEVRTVRSNSYSLATFNVGTYTLKVQAFATGYLDSEWSTSASYTKEAPQVVEAEKLAVPANLRESNKVITWDAVTNATSYKLEINGTEYAVNGRTYSVAGIDVEGDYIIKVKAVGDGVDYKDSDYSASITYEYEVAVVVTAPFEAPENLVVANKTLSWDAVDYAAEYEVSVNGTISRVAGTSFDLSSYSDIKDYTLAVRTLPNGDYTISNWSAPATFTIYGQLEAVEFIDGATNVQWYAVRNAEKYIVSYDNAVVVQTATSIDKVISTDTIVSVVAVAANYANSVVSSLDMAAKSFTFTVSGNNATITGLTTFGATATKIAVPSIIRTYKVTDYTTGCFESVKATITDLTVPFLKDKANAVGHFFNLTNANITSNLVNLTVTGDTVIAYQSCVQLKLIKKIEFLGSTNTISSYAFNGCMVMEELILPNNLKVIGERAFSDCRAITSLVLPDTVQSIGDMAFNQCSTLVTVNIPDGVKSIGSAPFNSCPALLGEVYGNTMHIGKWAIKATSTTITSADIKPGTLGVLEECYSNCSLMETVSIPDSVVFFGKNVFSKCDKLKVSDYNGLKYLGNWVYSSDSSISGVVAFKAGTVGILSNAFNSREDIDTVIIPDTITYIGDYAFQGCSNISSLTLSTSVKYIGRNAFQNSALTSVSIPEGMETISQEVFAGSKKLEVVLLPSTIKTIGENAFNNCSSLATINIPASVTLIQTKAFNNCSSLTRIILDGVTPATIVADAFPSGSFLYVPVAALDDYLAKWPESMSSRIQAVSDSAPDFILINNDTQLVRYIGTVSNVVIPETVTTISPYAFRDFLHVKKVTLGANVTTISAFAFYNCLGLEEIDFAPATNALTIGASAFYGAGLKTLVLPANVSLAEDSFAYNKELTSIALPSTLKVLPARVFQHAEKLVSIDISNVERIGMLAFYRCITLETVTTTSKLKVVEKQAFLACWVLETEKVDGINYIGNIAFSIDDDVKGTLTSATLRPGTTIIYDYLFSTIITGLDEDGKNIVVAATNIKSVNLTGITSIGFQSFMNSYITTLTIPSSVLYIAGQAFDTCLDLTTVVYETSADISDFAFYGCKKLSTFTLDSSSAPATIGAEAFKECIALTSFALPESVKLLGQGAFNGCIALETVTLGAVEQVKDGAFAGTTALESIVLPASIKTLGTLVTRTETSGSSTTVTTSFAQKAMFAGSGVKTITIQTNATINSSDSNIFVNAKSLEKIIFDCTGFTFAQGQFWLQNTEATDTVAELKTYTALKHVVFTERFTMTNLSVTNNSFQRISLDSMTVSTPTLLACLGSSLGGTAANKTLIGKVYVPSGLVTDYQGANAWKNYTIEAIIVA